MDNIKDIYYFETEPIMLIVNVLIYSHWLVKMLESWSEPWAIIFAAILTIFTILIAYRICKEIDKRYLKKRLTDKK